MNPWLKLKFPKRHEIEILTLLIAFRASKCRLSPRHGFIRSKLVYFEIFLEVTK